MPNSSRSSGAAMAGFSTTSSSTARFERDLQTTALCVVAMIVSAYALRALFEFADMPLGTDSRLKFPVPQWLVAIGLVTVIPVLEEVAFRGLLMTWLRKLSLSFWSAAGISSAAFVAVHLP